jgi:hypothetical protein
MYYRERLSDLQQLRLHYTFYNTFREFTVRFVKLPTVIERDIDTKKVFQINILGDALGIQYETLLYLQIF